MEFVDRPVACDSCRTDFRHSIAFCDIILTVVFFKKSVNIAFKLRRNTVSSRACTFKKAQVKSFHFRIVPHSFEVCRDTKHMCWFVLNDQIRKFIRIELRDQNIVQPKH